MEAWSHPEPRAGIAGRVQIVDDHVRGRCRPRGGQFYGKDLGRIQRAGTAHGDPGAIDAVLCREPPGVNAYQNRLRIARPLAFHVQPIASFLILYVDLRLLQRSAAGIPHSDRFGRGPRTA